IGKHSTPRRCGRVGVGRGCDWPRGRQSAAAYTFDQICAPPATATPEATATPTMTPTPTSTNTPVATAIPVADQPPATATPTWTVAPLPTATSLATPTSAPDNLPTQSVALAESATRPLIQEFRVDPSQIAYGEQAMLTWVVEQATQVTLHPAAGEDANGVDSVASVGNRSVEPALSTRYTLIAVNGAGETRADVMLFVKPSHTTPTPQPTPTLDPAPALAQPATPAPDPTAVLDLPAPEVATATAIAIVPTLVPEPEIASAAETPTPEDAPTVADAATVAPLASVTPVASVTEIPAPEAVSGGESEPESDPAPEVVALVPPVVTALPTIESNTDAPPSPVSVADPESDRVRLLALITGSALILGAPLLFAFVWVIVWSIWRKP
ncbi:MAG: hypothetical protein WDZ49_06550, partial [Litorilinea sp.]